MAKDVRAADRGHEVERVQTFGASILDDQIGRLTAALGAEADDICVIAETTYEARAAHAVSPVALPRPPPRRGRGRDRAGKLMAP